MKSINDTRKSHSPLYRDMYATHSERAAILGLSCFGARDFNIIFNDYSYRVIKNTPHRTKKVFSYNYSYSCSTVQYSIYSFF